MICTACELRQQPKMLGAGFAALLKAAVGNSSTSRSASPRIYYTSGQAPQLHLLSKGGEGRGPICLRRASARRGRA